jgi:hypothetical protein
MYIGKLPGACRTARWRDKLDMRDLTVHHVTLINALWETLEIVAGQSITLTPTKAFVLGGAFLVHDLGMGLAAYPDGLADLQINRQWTDLLIASLRTQLGQDPDPREIADSPLEVIDEVKSGSFVLSRLSKPNISHRFPGSTPPLASDFTLSRITSRALGLLL